MPDWYSHPHWLLAIFLVAAGFWLLIKGADKLVAGGVAIAARFQLSMAVIGATIVAFGTSLPELVVSVGSSIKGAASGTVADPDGPAAIAIANIVGSNIFNIAAILGISAMLARLQVSRSTLRLDYPLMLVVFLAFIGFAIPWGDATNGVIDRWEAAILAAGLIAFTVTAIKLGKVDPDEIPEVDPTSMGRSLGLILLGILGLMVGGDLALNGAISLAKSIGLSNRIIGLTVMAIGTSLPELVTSIQAARQGHAELAVANVVGSNLFNVLCIIGISGMILPLPVPGPVIAWDFLWMMGFSLLLLPMMLRKGGMGRPSGIILTVALLVFIGLTLAQPTPISA